MLRPTCCRALQLLKLKRCWASGSFQPEAASQLLNSLASEQETKVLTEVDALKVVGTFGVGILERHYVELGDGDVPDLTSKVPKVSAVKGVLRYADGSLVTHKTEHKAIELAVPASNANKVAQAFIDRFKATDLQLEGLMFREWVEYEPQLGNEILLSAYQDPVFGPCVVIGFGGVLVDHFKEDFKIPPFVLPVVYGVDSFMPALRESLAVRLLVGDLRGREKLLDWADLERVVRSLAEGILHFSPYNPTAKFTVDEIEVNPAAIESGRLVALDSVVQVSPASATKKQSTTSMKPLAKVQKLLQPKSIGLLGCSEKVPKKTQMQVIVGNLFTRLARSSFADVILLRLLKQSVFRRISRKTGKPRVANPNASANSFLKSVSAWIQTAVVPQTFKPANTVLERAIESGIKVYPVHPRASEIQGVKCVSSLQDMKEKNDGKPVDLLVVAIPAPDAVKALEDSFEKDYCETVQLFTAGFAETESGGQLQERLLESLAKLDSDPVRRPLINGPNTVGNWVSGPRSFTTIFADNPKGLVLDSIADSMKPAVAIICQSGGFAVARLSGFSQVVHTSMCVTVGNQMDVGACDILENLLVNGPPEGVQFPEAVGIYLEGTAGLGDGLRLMMLISQARKRGMTVVVYKAGRTQEGQSAVASHTASMATDYGTFERLLKHAGAVISDSLEDFHTLISLAAVLAPNMKDLITNPNKPETVGVCGVTNSGYLKCGMADGIPTPDPGACSKIVPATYNPETQAVIEKVLSDHKLTDVVDVGDFLDITPSVHLAGWYELMYGLLQDPNPAVYIFAPVITPGMVPMPKVMSILFGRVHQVFPDKPFIACIESGYRYAWLRQELWRQGIPCFESADIAMRMVCRLITAWSRPM